jgi:metal-responsive CopG/Arc/MetJ family transcriptional regulator
MEVIMRTIQMTLDDDLVKIVDDIAKELETTRSAFTRDALREAVKKYNIRRLELKHRQGYAAQPVNKEEFSVWEKEQNWGDK